jgi:molybdopterin-containing oxidoreductase family iron-sulfur binding subunit
MKPNSTDTAANAAGSPRELNELDAQGYADAALNEFPEGASEFTDEPSRRRFLTLMGASVALATAAGCNLRPASQRKILPYTTQPDEITPGVPLFFASAAPLGGYGQGVLVRSSEGRPIKIEGNPDSPSSLGGASIHSLASVLDLYDPDRSRSVTHNGLAASYEQAVAALRGQLFKEGTPNANLQLRVLTETVTSPTFAKEMTDLLALFPKAKWVQFDAVSNENAREGIKKAFGKPLSVTYDVNKADVIVSLDADFLCSGPGHVRYARDFSDRRKIRENGKDAAEIAAGRKPGQPFKEGVKFDPAADVKHSLVNRLYSIETMPTNTGAVADHRLALTGAQIVNFVNTLAAALGVPNAKAAGEWSPEQKKWAEELAKDLKDEVVEDKDKKAVTTKVRKGKTIVVAGDHLPAAVHAAVAAINSHLGNNGQTVHYTAPVEASVAGKMSDLKTLVAEMNAKAVDVLLILGNVNPAYSAPADLDFAKSLKDLSDNKKLTLHLGSHVDETNVLCEWHIPEAHYLETWGDIRGYNGTVTIQQPLIMPLHGGKSAIELLVTLLKPATAGVPGSPHDPLDIVKATWSSWFESQKKTGPFEVFWQQSVRKGVVEGTAAAPENVALGNWAEGASAPAAPVASGEYEINFRACPALYDGRYANNGWLQELPKPHTKISWDNAAFMSEKTRVALGIKRSFRWTGGEHGRAEVSIVEIKVGDRTVKAPAWILPDHADGAITVHLGHGRTRAGSHVGNIEGRYNVNPDGEQVRGFNAYKIRASNALWTVGGKVANTMTTYFLACTQGHWTMAERDPISGKSLNRQPIRIATLADFKQVPQFAKIPPTAVGETELINDNIPLPVQPGQHVPTAPKPGEHNDSDHKPHGEHARIYPLNMYNPMEGLVPDLRDAQRRRWAMAIDLNACTGCSACVVACQSENNTPVVGKEQVTKAREMYWISIDRYYEGPESDPNAIKAYYQPRMCVQCENAPCEIVCPVGATVHSADGLNDMTYNRCVGTRYCSNNCPYKVRRFNFLSFDDVYTWDTDTIKLGRNPDVTVRSRGVMEKCTFCVQRIRGAEIVAEREGRAIRDGEILTACQSACPSGAIVFGDINQADSAVSKWKNEPTNYGLLAELNTRPRLTHLAVVRNPNPALK